MSANPRDIPTMRMVVGSTSERYTTSGDISFGLIRYNTTDNNVEAYAKDGWVNLQGGSGGGKWTLGANGHDDYTFEGTGLTGTVNDPTLYLVRGNKYTFVNGNGSGAHPFKIQTTNGVQYDTGVTNNLGGGGTTITFEVPQDAPNELEYVCTSHPAMSGKLIIVGSGGVGSDASLSSIVQYTDNSGITFLSDVSVNGVLNSTDGSFSGNLYSTSGIIGGAGGWILGANGSSNYTFTGSGLTGSESNPTLNLFRGNKYIFINNTGGHPFQISKSDNSAYGTGVTNNGGAGGSTITFEVPHDAPKTLKYICTAHSSAMYGDINIHGGGSAVDASFQSDVTIAGNLYVDGSFNFGEVIQNITTVNNELLISTQVDISNYGTGPALSVTQHGDGAADNLVLLHAGTDGSAVEVKGDGKSIFYKDVSFHNDVDISGNLNVKGVIDNSLTIVGNIIIQGDISAANFSSGTPTTNVIAPVAYAKVNTDSAGSGTGMTWAAYNSGNGEMLFTFDTPLSDANYYVLAEREQYDTHSVNITNKSINEFKATWLGNDGTSPLAPSIYGGVLIVYASTPTIPITGGGRKSGNDGSFNVIGEFNLNSGTTFLNDVSINTRLIVPDASFNRIAPIDGSLVIMGDLSVNGQIFSSGGLVGGGGGGGSGTDASFNVIGDFLDGSGVTFLTDVSINGDFKNSGFADLSSKVFLNTVTTTFNTGTIVDLSDVVTAMSTHFVAVDASFQNDVNVKGNLYVDGSFNFSEVVKNITTVDNELLISTQVDISNYGTGPALSVTQHGDGVADNLVLLHAGTEGTAVEVKGDGKSIFYKDVDISGKLVLSGDISINGNLIYGGFADISNKVFLNTVTTTFNTGTIVDLSDVVTAMSTKFTADDASFYRIAPIDGSLVLIGDLSVNGNIFSSGGLVGGGGGSGTDASFNVIDEFMDGSGVTFLTDVSFQNDITVGGNLYVDGSFNFGEVIKNITTVNNELLISTQVDISNYGTGPALSVTQHGDGAADNLVLLHAGTDGSAVEIKGDGKSIFYKDVSFINNVEIDGKLLVSGDVSINKLIFNDGTNQTTAVNTANSLIKKGIHSSSTSGEWYRYQSIFGSQVNKQFGTNVAINGDGSIVASGAHNEGANGKVSIYIKNDSSYVQLGDDISGVSDSQTSNLSIGSGSSPISLNKSGDIIAIGIPLHDQAGQSPISDGHWYRNFGKTTIYKWNDISWVSYGGDILGAQGTEQNGNNLDEFKGAGDSVALNDVGDIIAIGSPAGYRGRVDIYNIINNTWVQKGLPLMLTDTTDGIVSSDKFGHSVSINSSGNIVAVGGYENDGATNNEADIGIVKIYQWNGTIWSAVGNPIYGERAGDESGYSISLNDDGKIIAIGAPKNDDPTTSAGHVRIYKWDGSVWTQLGNDIDGTLSSGRSVSIDSIGHTLIVGEQFNTQNTGHVQIYNYNESSSLWDLTKKIYSVDQGTNVGLSVAISSDAKTIVYGVPSGNAIGDEIFIYKNNAVSEQNDTIDVSGILVMKSGFILEGEKGIDKIKQPSTIVDSVDTTNINSWSQRGNIVIGNASDSLGKFHKSISLNNDGTILAVGTRPGTAAQGYNGDYTQVYKFNNNLWNKLGGRIDGFIRPANIHTSDSALESSIDNFELNGAGDKLIIGAPRYPASSYGGGGLLNGRVRVFDWSETDTSWNQVTSWTGNHSDFFGYSTTINKVGDIIAFGSPNAKGKVYIYQRSGNTFSALGNVIEGLNNAHGIGKRINISSDGLVIAVNGKSTNSKGLTNVYRLVGSTWTKDSTDIYGDNNNDNFGVKGLSISGDGNVLAVGSGSGSGYVKTFLWNDGTSSWGQIGSTINGENSGDNFGTSLELNEDGTIMSIGAYGYDVTKNGSTRNSRGKVYIYKRVGNTWTINTSFVGIGATQAGYSVATSGNGLSIAYSSPTSDVSNLYAGVANVYNAKTISAEKDDLLIKCHTDISNSLNVYEDASFQNDVEIERNLIVRGDISGVNKITFAGGASMTTAPSSSTLPFEYIQSTAVAELTGSSGTGLYPGAALTLLTKSITPTSASQKVLITAKVSGRWATSPFRGNLTIKRSVSGQADVLLTPPVAGQRTVTTATMAGHTSSTSNIMDGVSVLYIDDPGTTSQVTYTPLVYNSQAGYSFFFNCCPFDNFGTVDKTRQRAPSAMTLRCF